MNRDQVKNMLGELEAADEREEGFRVRMLELLEVSGDPFSRGHWSPGHFTASTFVLDPSGSSIVLIDHVKLKRWLQPGGHVDPEDSDLVAAARRELAEEAGLIGCELVSCGSDLLDVDVHSIPSLKGEPPHEHFDLRFLFRSETEVLRAGSDVGGARWVKLEDVSAELADESVMRAVRKIRALR